MAHIDWSFAAFFFTLLLIFILNFPSPNPKRIWELPVFILGGTVVFTAAFTSLIVRSIDITNIGVEVVRGPLEMAYEFFLYLYVLISGILLVRKLRQSRGVQRAQSLYVLVGFFTTTVIALAANLVLPEIISDLVQRTFYQRFGIYGVLVLLGSSAYAILAHRLFDIRVVIKKTVIYSGLLAFVIGAYSLVIFTAATIFGSKTGVSTDIFFPNLIAALVVAAGFEPIRKWLVETTDKYLFVGEYKPEEVLRNLTQTLSSVIDLDEALRGMMQIVVKDMRLKKAVTFVVRRYKEQLEVKRVISVGFTNPGKLTLEKGDPLIAQFESRLKNRRDHTERRKLALVSEELERRIEEVTRPPSFLRELLARLKELNAAVALPIVVRGELIGILVLSDKLSGDVFTSSDLDFLEIISHETGGAIEKARLWEEDQLKTEFVSIASHELLTPTSTIQGYLSMILDEGLGGKVDPKAREYLEIVRKTSKRLTELVQDLLNVSRIESGRIKINLQPMDLLAMIREVVTDLTPKAHDKQLSVHFEDPVRQAAKMKNEKLKMENEKNSQFSILNSQFTVLADPERVRQIITNLISNAVKYTEKGGVTVAVEKEGRLVKVKIADTGIGISQEDQLHLFEKFYRVHTEHTKEISGTGLGLYICKNTVELMGGKIGLETKEGHGSIFYFTLPLTDKPPQQESATPAVVEFASKEKEHGS